MKTKKNLIAFALLIAAMLVVAPNVVAQQKVDVKTLFRLLPDDAFEFQSHRWKNDRAELDSYIKVCDYKNGFLRLEFDSANYWEMCYWNLKNGNKLIAVRYDPLSSASFYLYADGKIESTSKFGTDEIHEDINNSIADNCCDNTTEFLIPRYGTSIYAVHNTLDAFIYKWQNEHFVRLTEYPTQNSTHEQLFKGFATALTAADTDRCLQYICPRYVVAQCMGLFDGKKEHFICDLIAGKDDKGYLKPDKLRDIKKATYRYTPNSGSPTHTLFIELKNGRSYTIQPDFTTVEIYESIDSGEDGDLVRSTPYIIGGEG